MSDKTSFFSKTISKKQASESGMAVVLILLLIGLFTGNDLYYKIAIPILIIVMAFPMFFKYFAVIWLGLSEIIGTIASKIILSIVYIIVLLPVGIFRRMTGKDSLQLKQFKKSGSGVMKTRNHRFSSEDIINPY